VIAAQGLANGGANSLPFVANANLSPTGTNNSPTYTFSISIAQLGLTPNVASTIFLFGTYISNSSYRSDEAVAGNDVGQQGWNTFLQTEFVTYRTLPAPSTLALLGLGGLIAGRRRNS
jgi:hypothetical protein